jgi:hypothetical protein
MLEILTLGNTAGAYPDSGPGPKSLKFGDTNAGYFGTVTQTELFTAAEVIAATGLSPAKQIADANMLWVKFFWKGKVIYYPTQQVSNDLSWNQYSAANVVYSNANSKTLTKTSNNKQRTFRIRLPLATLTDPADRTVNKTSEFYALFAKVIAIGVTNAGWATGTWDSLTAPVASINKYLFTQTTLSTNSANAIWVMYDGTLATSAKSNAEAINARGYMPVLELVDLT